MKLLHEMVSIGVHRWFYPLPFVLFVFFVVPSHPFVVLLPAHSCPFVFIRGSTSPPCIFRAFRAFRAFRGSILSICGPRCDSWANI